jgi:hypothetical protein
MALSPTVVWEVRTTGSDGNGGGFDSAAAGTDRSQQDAAHVTIDGAVITATVNAGDTTILDITGYTPSAADIGNLVNVTGGTATAGVYQIISFPGAGQWGMDRSVGAAGASATGAMGGANATPGWVSGKHVDQNLVWIKSGTYLLTSSSPSVANGLLRPTRGKWEGYETTRGDLGAKPILRASGINTVELLVNNGNEAVVVNLEVDGDNLVSIRGIRNGGRTAFYFCTVRNCTNSGFLGGVANNCVFVGCAAIGCTTAGRAFDMFGGAAVVLLSCVARDNTVPAFAVSGMSTVSRCLAYDNTGAAVHGFLLAQATCCNCIAYGNGGDGFTSTSFDNHYVNCVAESNTGAGFRASTIGVATAGETRFNCAGFNNTGGNTAGVFRFDGGFITGTSTFFTNPAGDDFTLNTAAGGGTLLRGTAYPTTLPDTSTDQFLDRGAVQTSGSGGGGGGGGNIPFVTLGESWG